jgi:hypothetical protein
MKILEHLGKIRYFVLFCLLVLSVYLMAGFRGFYLLGDDEEAVAAETAGAQGSGARGMYRYYHK